MQKVCYRNAPQNCARNAICGHFATGISHNSGNIKKMDIDTIIISCATALIGGIVGTYGSSYFITRKQEERQENIRKIALRALDIFKNYDGKTYHDAESEFNTKLSITEKRIILVALYKIGIPIFAENIGKFSLENVSFMSKEVTEKEIINMKAQIDSGNCDNLFFEDPEDYFNKNILDKYKRNIAIKFIRNVLMPSQISNDEQCIVYPENWWDGFSIGEINIALVFKAKLADPILYDKNTRQIKQEKIEEIINEVNIGLWDTYLYWAYEAFSNVQTQKSAADKVLDIITNQQYQQPAIQPQQETNNDAAK